MLQAYEESFDPENTVAVSTDAKSMREVLNSFK